MTGKLLVKTEEDKRKRELAEKLSKELFQKVEQIAKEKNWDTKRDFRRILDKIEKDEK